MSIISAIQKSAAALPNNYPPMPVRYPLPLFRQQLEAANRYLFDGERREALLAANIPLNVLSGVGDPAVNVAQIAVFMQQLRVLIGQSKSIQFGHEAFTRVASQIPKPSLSPLPRAVSSFDKFFYGYEKRLPA